jgi:hypothetical protein
MLADDVIDGLSLCAYYAKRCRQQQSPFDQCFHLVIF